MMRAGREATKNEKRLQRGRMKKGKRSEVVQARRPTSSVLEGLHRH
jgi:hypothetical protein